jgi:transposase
LAELVNEDVVLRRMATIVGPVCSAAIGALVGSPLGFTSAGALEKAMGLNLKEKSSGDFQGRMSITKWGPGQVRHLMFMAALRLLKDDMTALAWCHARKAYKADQKIKAVVALMRKRLRADIARRQTHADDGCSQPHPSKRTRSVHVERLWHLPYHCPPASLPCSRPAAP